MENSKITNRRKKTVRRRETAKERKERQKRIDEDNKGRGIYVPPPKPSLSPGKAWDYAMEEWLGDQW